MSDQFEEIKARATLRAPDYDREWLIAEVERLRTENVALRSSELEVLRYQNEKLRVELADTNAACSDATEIEALREFVEIVVAMCVPMNPPADNPVSPVIASLLLNLAEKLSKRTTQVSRNLENQGPM